MLQGPHSERAGGRLPHPGQNRVGLLTLCGSPRARARRTHPPGANKTIKAFRETKYTGMKSKRAPEMGGSAAS